MVWSFLAIYSKQLLCLPRQRWWFQRLLSQVYQEATDPDQSFTDIAYIKISQSLSTGQAISAHGLEAVKQCLWPATSYRGAVSNEGLSPLHENTFLDTRGRLPISLLSIADCIPLFATTASGDCQTAASALNRFLNVMGSFANTAGSPTYLRVEAWWSWGPKLGP